MATAESVKSKLQSLITASNAKTGKSDANLTDAVNTLLEGYGQGEEVAEYDGSVVIEDAVKLISFTISGLTYQAEEGMTWEEWCNSEYDTSNSDGALWVADVDGYVSNENLNYVSTDGSSSGRVLATDTITADYAYSTYLD